MYFLCFPRPPSPKHVLLYVSIVPTVSGGGRYIRLEGGGGGPLKARILNS